MRKDYIICILGSSGSGKTSICNMLKENYHLNFVESYTTRPKRHENESGHTFVTTDEFQELKDHGIICGYTIYNSYEYGATIEQVENNDVYVIDEAGLDFFKLIYAGKKKIYSIFIDASAEQRRKRMLKRGDSVESVEKRLSLDEIIFSNTQSKCDISFCNNNLENTADKIYDAITYLWDKPRTVETKILIFGKRIHSGNKFLDNLIGELKFKDVKRYANQLNGSYAELADGTQYKVLPSSDYARGHKGDIAYVEFGIDEEVFQNVIRPSIAQSDICQIRRFDIYSQ